MLETLDSLTSEAHRLKAGGRLVEALSIYRRAVQRFPASGVALHNLAGTLGDLGEHDEAAQLATRALRTGLDAPETWLVLARAELGRGEPEAALRAYREVLRRRPDSLPAHLEATQLIWMSTGSREEALRGIDEAVRRLGADPGLLMVKAQALESMGDAQAALDALGSATAAPACAPELLAYASHLSAATGNPLGAIRLAERSVQAAPGDPGSIEALARARLAAGDVPGAEALLQPLSAHRPANQHLLAMRAVAWRLSGDPRYRELYDYPGVVQAKPLAVPEGWSDLAGYVASLAAELKQAHRFRTHPFGQSLRQGSQLPDVLRRTSPAVAAFAQALSGPLTDYLARIGRGRGPLAGRNTGRAAIAGSWSVWLRPGGHHVDHVHQEGWISAVCYLELPAVVAAGGREGWLRFGRPGLVLPQDLPAEHWVRPEPGLVALFPSYMWHGTEPFSGSESRLTLAFDLVPA